MMGILGQDGIDADWPRVFSNMQGPGLAFYASNQLVDSRRISLAGKMPPAWQGLNLNQLAPFKLDAWSFSSPKTVSILPRAIDPNALERLAPRESSHTLSPGPVLRSPYQAFFAAMGQHVAKAVYLRRLFIADDDCLIPPAPEPLLPAVHSTDLSGHVRVEIVHEARHLKSVFYAHEQMVVIREEDEGVDLDGIEPLCPAQDPDHNPFQLLARFEEETTLHCTACHLHKCSALRNES
jgi:hypothetical protein